MIAILLLLILCVLCPPIGIAALWLAGIAFAVWMLVLICRLIVATVGGVFYLIGAILKAMVRPFMRRSNDG